MTFFESVRATFDSNWTTVLVGWNGLGEVSPWPERWVEFPPLLSSDEIVAYCDERIALSSVSAEINLIVDLLTSDLRSESREAVKHALTPLSALSGGNPSIELRKWRLVILEDVLERLPKDAIYGLIMLTEFWQSVGFPSDSPHVVQGRGNVVTPSEYYQQDNLDRLIARHRAWIESEKMALQNR